MTLIERVEYYAKGVWAAAGAVVTFTAVILSVVDDNTVGGDEWGILGGAALTLITTVVAVVKTKNGPNPEKV